MVKDRLSVMGGGLFLPGFYLIPVMNFTEPIYADYVATAIQVKKEKERFYEKKKDSCNGSCVAGRLLRKNGILKFNT